MDRLLPIEADCLCLIIAGPYQGKEVTTIRFVGPCPIKTPPDGGLDNWEVKADWIPARFTGCAWARQAVLMRLGGNPDQERHTEKERPVPVEVQ